MIGNITTKTPQNNNIIITNIVYPFSPRGADIIGINCSFGPFVALETIGMMKEALDAEGLSPYLMAQPAGWYTSEVRNDVMGYVSLPEMPFGT